MAPRFTPRFAGVLTPTYILYAVVGVLVGVYGTEWSYLQFGPSENLVVLGVVINTSARYGLMLLLFVLNGVLAQLNSALVKPLTTFFVQRPKRQRIVGITRGCFAFLVVQSNLQRTLMTIGKLLAVVERIDCVIAQFGAELAVVSICNLLMLWRNNYATKSVYLGARRSNDDDDAPLVGDERTNML